MMACGGGTVGPRVVRKPFGELEVSSDPQETTVVMICSLVQVILGAVLRRLPAPSSSPHMQSVCVTSRPGDEQSL